MNQRLGHNTRRCKARPLLLVAMLAMGVAVSPPASADIYDATLARAIAAKERALEINDPAHWEEAMRLFGEADRVRSTKESKYELGFAAVQMHAYDLAVEAYQAALDLGIVGTARSRAEAFVAQHASKMGRVEVVGPAGVAVYVRDQHRGVLPLARPLVVFPGDIDFLLPRPDGVRETLRATVTAGGLTILRVSDRTQQATSVLPPANPLITPPPASTGLPAGSPAGSPSRDAVSSPISSPSRDSHGLPVPSPSPSMSTSTGWQSPDGSVRPVDGHGGRWPSGWPFVISGVVLAAAAGATVALASVTLDDKRARLGEACAVLEGPDQCKRPRTDQQGTQDLVDSIATWKAVHIGAWVGVGAGAAAAIAGAVFMLGNRSADRTPTGRTTTLWYPELRVTPGGGMFVLGGTL